MKIRTIHPWNLTPRQAIELQRTLAGRVCAGPPLARVSLVAGTDVSFHRPSRTMYAAVVIYALRDRKVVERVHAIAPETFPYVPGLLSFREVPVLLEAFRQIEHRPDVVLADGQGLAHPRRFGLACHLGLCVDLPTVGCAKSRLIGVHRMPALRRGSAVRLTDAGELIGRVVRTRDAVKPVWVSVGHRIDLASAVRVVLRCASRFRLPEPIREAHRWVNALRREREALVQDRLGL
jgi:deoxyribonuclease V